MLKSKTTRKLSLAIAGGIYLSLFSSLNMNPIFKGYVVIIPIQLAALVYGIYLIRKQALITSSSNRKIRDRLYLKSKN